MNQLSEQLYRSLVQHRQQPAVLWLGGLQPGSHITLSYSQLLAAAAFVHARLPLGAGARLALACQGPVAAAAVCAGLLYGWSLVPLNPEEPRLGSMLASAQPQAMLCTAKSPAAAQAGRLRLVEAEGLEEAMLRHITDAAVDEKVLTSDDHCDRRDDDVTEAHVYFTSGSTGKPKGVRVSRSALQSYVLAKNRAHRVSGPGARCLVASAPTFDPWLTDLAACWISGATAVLAPRPLIFAHLADCLRQSRCTHILTTPGLFATLDCDPHDLTSHLQVVALGGEAMSADLAAKWLPHVTLLNTYGVTECCGYQTVHQVTSIADRTMLGHALGQNRLIMAAAPGDDPLREVDNVSSAFGELWIAGPQVGLGYLEDVPPAAAAAFALHEGLGRCYRTGDLIKRQDDNLVLLGRRDAQLKIRGNRIEPGEIEAAIAALCPAAFARIAVVKPSIPIEGCSEGSEFLAAWCELGELRSKVTAVPDGKADQEQASVNSSGQDLALWGDQTLYSAVLRQLIQTSLPPHMVPRCFLIVPPQSLPLTSSGKIDRRLLSQRPPSAALDGLPGDEQAVVGSAAADFSVGDPDPAASQQHFQQPPNASRPLTAFEKLVADAWSRVLHFPVSSPEADFSALSGDSLTALRIVREVHVMLTSMQEMATDRLPAAPVNLGEGADWLGPVTLLANPRLEDYAALLRQRLRLDETSACAANGDSPAPAPLANARDLLLYQVACSDAVALLNLMLVQARSAIPFAADTLATALHRACAKGKAAAVDLLLSHGASAIWSDVEGRSALHYAAQGCNASIVSMLLASKNASVFAKDTDGQLPIHHASRHGAGRRVLNLLLDPASASSSAVPGASAAPIARKGKKAGPASRKADDRDPIATLSATDRWGRTPLHWAVDNGHRVAVDVLVAAGAAPTLVDAAGETPLQLAERRAQCSAQDRPLGMRPSVFGDIATLLGGSGATQRKKKGSAADG